MTEMRRRMVLGMVARKPTLSHGIDSIVFLFARVRTGNNGPSHVD
jgi:hypothetical protein